MPRDVLAQARVEDVQGNRAEATVKLTPDLVATVGRATTQVGNNCKNHLYNNLFLFHSKQK